MPKLEHGNCTKRWLTVSETTHMSYHPYNSNLKVEWEDIGEGLNGDYDPNDPDDKQLLRFDVSYRQSRKDDWEAVPDSSYCTMIENTCPPRILKAILRYIYKEVDKKWRNGCSVKKLCEYLSWLDSDREIDFDTIKRTPDNKLPLLIGSIKTDEGKKELERRLKGA